MFYLLYDPTDSNLQFEFLESHGPDMVCYSWFNLRTLDLDYNKNEGTLNAMNLASVLHDTDWKVITTYRTMPTASKLRAFLEDSPELFI